MRMGRLDEAIDHFQKHVSTAQKLMGSENLEHAERACNFADVLVKVRKER